jgi:hypothetical protein
VATYGTQLAGLPPHFRCLRWALDAYLDIAGPHTPEAIEYAAADPQARAAAA